MDFSFTPALQQMGPNAPFMLMNEARPAANYLFAQFLPEMNAETYDVQSGSLTVRPTMAGLSGMDSPFAPTGLVEVSTFLEQSAKITSKIRLPEKAQRTLQAMMQRLSLSGAGTMEAMVGEVLNFTNALVVQPHLDTFEQLRGQALGFGAIDWTYNNKRLAVDYGIPAGNILPQRTGNDAYGGSTSKFWADMRELRRLLRYSVRAFVLHPDTLMAVLNNDANRVEVLSEGMGVFRIRRLVGTTDRPSSDARDAIELIAYGLEGEVVDPANPTGATKKIPFCPVGRVIALGVNSGTSYTVGAGSAAPTDYALGYTHLAPTVEGGGAPGRWARVRTPEEEPWALVGEGVTNGLPVVEAADKVAIARTDLPA